MDLEFPWEQRVCMAVCPLCDESRVSSPPFVSNRVLRLTHWGWDKMAIICQTTFSNTFSWMKMNQFWLKFHLSLFLRVQLTIFQHCFIYWLGADQATSHYLNQWWLVYWCIYASLGLNELITTVMELCDPGDNFLLCNKCITNPRSQTKSSDVLSPSCSAWGLGGNRRNFP